MDTILTSQERLKDLRVNYGLTLEQLAEQTGLSRAALGSYESDDFKDISHYAVIKLARFYGVTADYLLGLSEIKNHSNAELNDLHLSDDMIELLKTEQVNTPLLCEFVTHKNFVKLLADIEIYVNGMATMQIQNLNAWVDVARAEIGGRCPCISAAQHSVCHKHTLVRAHSHRLAQNFLSLGKTHRHNRYLCTILIL